MRRVGTLVEGVDDTIAITVEFAALVVDRLAGCRAGTLVGRVHDAVFVAVDLATTSVDQGTLRRAGAVVDSIADAVAVTVQPAAVGIDDGARRCPTAQVADVGNAIAVTVGLAARAVHGQAGGRARAAVVEIHYPVTVSIALTTLRVHRRVRHGVRATVEAIHHAVAIKIALAVADREGQIVDVGGEEGQRVVAFNPLPVTVADVVDQLEVGGQDPGVVEPREVAGFVPHTEVTVFARLAVPAVVDEGTVGFACQLRGVEAARVHDREVALFEGQHVGLRAVVVPGEIVRIDIAELVEGQGLVDMKPVFRSIGADRTLCQVRLAIRLQKDQRFADRVGGGGGAECIQGACGHYPRQAARCRRHGCSPALLFVWSPIIDVGREAFKETLIN